VIATKMAPVMRYNVTTAPVRLEMNCIAVRMALDSDPRLVTAAIRA